MHYNIVIQVATKAHLQPVTLREQQILKKCENLRILSLCTANPLSTPSQLQMVINSQISNQIVFADLVLNTYLNG